MGSDMALGLLVGLLLANYLVTRTGIARQYPALFWGITGLDALAAVAVLTLGMPGIEGRPLIRVMIALVILLHLAQNFQAKTRWDADARTARIEAELAERERLMAAGDEE